MISSDYTYEERRISVDEYQKLRAFTDWNMFGDELIEEALSRDLYSLVVYKAWELVAMARVIGDGAIYYYIQDLIVHPDFRNQGVATSVMNKIEAFLSKNAAHNSFIGLMAAEGTESFYINFGFRKRPGSAPGMFKYYIND